jgi:hypothetical protein
MLDELAGSRAKVADDVSEYAFNKNRVRLLAGNEGKIVHYVTIGLHKLTQKQQKLSQITQIT